MYHRTKRPRGRPAIPKEVQRQRLLDAALRVLEESQYEKMSIADIVRDAGMSSRSFYEHFDSKDDLVASIVEEQGRKFVDQLTAIVEETKVPEERGMRVMRAVLELFPAGTMDLERLGGEAGQRVREVRRSKAEVLIDLVHRDYQQLHARGLIPRVPERAAVEMVLMGIEALAFRYYSEGRREALLGLQPVLLRTLLRALS